MPDVDPRAPPRRALVVVDKPAVPLVDPRGRHVRQSVVVRLRDEAGAARAVAAAPPRRITSGAAAGDRAALARRRTSRCSRAARCARPTGPWPGRPDLVLPVVVHDHLTKRRGTWQDSRPGRRGQCRDAGRARVTNGDVGVYRLTPRTGRTHQLRVHLTGWASRSSTTRSIRWCTTSRSTTSADAAAAGRRAEFTDPFDGTTRRSASVRSAAALTGSGVGASSAAKTVIATDREDDAPPARPSAAAYSPRVRNIMTCTTKRVGPQPLVRRRRHPLRPDADRDEGEKRSRAQPAIRRRTVAGTTAGRPSRARTKNATRPRISTSSGARWRHGRSEDADPLDDALGQLGGSLVKQPMLAPSTISLYGPAIHRWLISAPLRPRAMS